jgi:pimeloyl-ACP methyl ester carboxylesterase
MPFLDRPDGRLHYELLQGEGAPVLMIQGAGVTGSGWKPQVDALAGDYRCLSFDNRAIGQSISRARTLTIEQMAADSIALMDSVGWPSAHIVGHSMGGLIAQQLALDAPQRVKSLALLCTFSQGPEAARLTLPVLKLGLRTRVGTRPMRRRAFLDMLFSRDYIVAQGAAALASRVGPLVGRDLADSPAIIMKQLAAMRAHDCSARLSELAHIPTLVMSAEHDPIALTAYGRRLSGFIPRSRYTEIRGASHGVTIEMPGLIIDALRLHFQQADSPLARTALT